MRAAARYCGPLVDSEGRVVMLRHGSAGESMLRANYLQLRSEMVEEGYITADQIESATP
jgi:hypothetical protein